MVQVAKHLAKLSYCLVLVCHSQMTTILMDIDEQSFWTKCLKSFRLHGSFSKSLSKFHDLVEWASVVVFSSLNQQSWIFLPFYGLVWTITLNGIVLSQTVVWVAKLGMV